jgi:TonB family protein
MPVVDPTAKKPTTTTGNEQPAVTPDSTTPNQSDPSSTTPVSPSTAEPAATSPDGTEPVLPAPTPVPPAQLPPGPDVSAANPTPVVPVTSKPSPVVPHSQPQYTAAVPRVPSSLQSQMATMVPEASGNKSAESALPAIEPVTVPELTERAFLVEQPPVAYPANAAGKQGSVTLQVLIGRDGTVQDAKFLQGSLAFARAAIDGVKQWRFKPYTVNGRPVSVVTNLTLKFAPAQ